MKILVLNGPNLNLLGLREPEIYGHGSYQDLVETIEAYAAARGVQVTICQSNHEGQLVDWIQAAYGHYDGLILNAAAYTHTSIALLDALKAVALPCVEVHLSDLAAREDFRQVSYIRSACLATISGLGFDSYLRAMDFLLDQAK